MLEANAYNIHLMWQMTIVSMYIKLYKLSLFLNKIKCIRGYILALDKHLSYWTSGWLQLELADGVRDGHKGLSGHMFKLSKEEAWLQQFSHLLGQHQQERKMYIAYQSAK